MTLKLVVFDCDGVLVDSEPVTNEIIARSLTQYGLPVTTAQSMDLFIGGTMQGVRDKAISLGARLPDSWLDEIYTEMYARLDQGVELISGVMDVVDRLEAAGIAIAVASNGPMEKMRRTLGPSGLWQRLDGHIHSREDHAPKPAPDMIQFAMKMADAGADETVMIDDAVSGCRAARNAGVRCIGFATEGQDNLLAAEGAEVVGSMDAVLSALGPLRAKS